MSLLAQADARRIPLADASVHCVVTSPPYWQKRNYEVAGQIGLEPDPDEFVDQLVEAFREVHRVLRADGTVWIVVGDTYVSRHNTGTGWEASTLGGNGKRKIQVGREASKARPPKPRGLKYKDLALIPDRLRLGLLRDGWYVRQKIAWEKPSAVPETARDRPTTSHEDVILLSKSESTSTTTWPCGNR